LLNEICRIVFTLLPEKIIIKNIVENVMELGEMKTSSKPFSVHSGGQPDILVIALSFEGGIGYE